MVLGLLVQLELEVVAELVELAPAALQQPRGSARGPQGSGAAHSCAVLLSPEKCALQLRVRQLEVEGCFIGGHGAAGEGRGRAGQEHS